MKKKSEFIDELEKSRTYITTQNNDIVNALYKNCLKYIKQVNLTGTREYIFEVPAIMSGYPVYDLVSVSGKVNLKLKRAGLKTSFIHPNNIYIRW